MAGERTTGRKEAALEQAQLFMTRALDLLDAYGGPPEAAVHLEMALQELREARKGDRPGVEPGAA